MADYKFPTGYASQLILAVLCNLQMLTFGITIGWLAPIEPQLRSQKSPIAHSLLTTEKISWLGSIPASSFLIATPLFCWCLQRYNSKVACILSNLISLVAYLLLLASQKLWIAYFARFLAGCGSAGSLVSVPIYMSESLPSCNYKIFSGFFITLGVALIYLLGACLNYLSVAMICVSFSVCFAMFSPWLPKIDAQRQLRNCKMDRGFRKAAMIALLITTTQQLSGIWPISTYLVESLNSLGSNVEPVIALAWTGGLQLSASLLSPLALKWIGRRKMLFTTGLAMSLSLFLLVLYLHLDHVIDWLPLASICGYVFFYSLGYGSVPFVLIPEILKPEAKGIIAGICGVWLGLLSFAVLKYYPFIPIPNVLLLFACNSFVGTFLVHLLLIETKDKSFEEIQRLLSNALAEG